MTVLLSLTVFLNTVSETMPNTSDAVPLISKPTVITIPRVTKLWVCTAQLARTHSTLILDNSYHDSFKDLFVKQVGVSKVAWSASLKRSEKGVV